MRHREHFSLLTFYKFVDIPESDAQRLVDEQWQFTHDLGLKGRVYIGTEGISSTVTGNAGQLWAYRAYLESTGFFKDIPDIDVKSTPVDGHQFDKMIVKYRDEIVAMGVKVTAQEVKQFKKELSPEAFKDIIDSGKTDDYVILDMRNDYEYRLGHFKGAIPAGTTNFREVPKLLERYKEATKGKKIIWYCTGGIRCEKAAVIMNKAGIEEVYSLEGGVVKYVNSHNDGNWLGNLYTFDGRVSTEVGDEETHTTIGECLYTGELTDNCENCRYAPCNARLITTKKAYRKHFGFCSKECASHARLDGFVRSVDWDDFQYKLKVREAKRLGGSQETSIMKSITDHIDAALAWVVFNHKESQKEEDMVEA